MSSLWEEAFQKGYEEGLAKGEARALSLVGNS